MLLIYIILIFLSEKCLNNIFVVQALCITAIFDERRRNFVTVKSIRQ